MRYESARSVGNTTASAVPDTTVPTGAHTRRQLEVRRIGKTFTFDAAHFLPNHDGKCRNLHGHTYHVEVVFEGPLHEEGPQEGMILDFGKVSDSWKRMEPRYDHKLLNDLFPNPTAEVIAESIWLHFAADELFPQEVKVWETPTSWASYRNPA